MIFSTLFTTFSPSYKSNLTTELSLPPLSITQRIYSFVNKYLTNFTIISIQLLITASVLYIIYKKQKTIQQKVSTNKVEMKIVNLSLPTPAPLSFQSSNSSFLAVNTKMEIANLSLATSGPPSFQSPNSSFLAVNTEAKTHPLLSLSLKTISPLPNRNFSTSQPSSPTKELRFDDFLTKTRTASPKNINEYLNGN